MAPLPHPPPLTRRLRATTALMRLTSRTAKALGRGGAVLGGHVGLALDHDLISHLSQGRWIAVVSATNGKTTMTSLLVSALSSDGPVVSNVTGANLQTGIAAALASRTDVGRAALEVDEATLAKLAVELDPRVVVLGNLSRDQLDRYGEVRIVAQRWRAMFAQLAEHSAGPPAVVANADDPLVVWAASEVPDVTWVAAGMGWTADSAICPSCGGTIAHDGAGWTCGDCELRRPAPHVDLRDDVVVFHDADGEIRVTLSLRLPGRFNLANAALALAAARFAGIDPQIGAQAMADTGEVAGRYRTVDVDGRIARLLMAKNPAGWQESLGILALPPDPVVVAINARVADGHDPSWLWDVDFAALAGRTVIATGDRADDLSVRLHYAEVDHEVRPGRTIDALRSLPRGPVEVVANYTAFADLLDDLPGSSVVVDPDMAVKP